MYDVNALSEVEGLGLRKFEKKDENICCNLIVKGFEVLQVVWT